jgi:RNA polymerase sigma-70 factor (ECF subfamily)
MVNEFNEKCQVPPQVFRFLKNDLRTLAKSAAYRFGGSHQQPRHSLTRLSVPMQFTLKPIAQNESKFTDRELIEAALGGEESGFVQLVQRYQDRLIGAIQNNVGCRVMAEDIVQDAFIKAFRSLASFRHDSHFYTWIFRIALNSRRRYISQAKDDLSLESINGEQLLVSTDERVSPVGVAESREDRKQVHDALDRLNAQQRTLLILRELNGFDYKTIAEILRVKKGTVRSRLFRARAELRNELAGYYYASTESDRSQMPR